jgi:hypothetical protein
MEYVKANPPPPPLLPLFTDLSGNSLTHTEIFILLMSSNWSHLPNSVDEAIALYRYLMKAEIEPVLEGILKVCGGKLNSEDKDKLKTAVTNTVPVVQSRGWCG